MPRHAALLQLVGQSNLSGVKFCRDITALDDGDESAKHCSCSMIPCLCGFAGDPARMCRCGSSAIARYQKRISGPLLDRIDIHLEVLRIDYEQLADCRAGEPSAAVRGRVEAARVVQAARFAGTALATNSTWGRGSCRSTRRWMGRGRG